MSTRVIAYVDGFNVYYGMKRKGWRDRLWLDYWALMESIALEHHSLSAVHYFTALSNQHDSQRRQRTYLNALETRGVTIHEGRMTTRAKKCPECDHKVKRPQEKESDVRFALQLAMDAVEGRMDEAWVVTRDTDLAPAVALVVERFGLKVVVVKPPLGSGDRSERRSALTDELVRASTNNAFHLDDRLFARCQLPLEVQGKRAVYRRPEEWSPGYEPGGRLVP